MGGPLRRSAPSVGTNSSIKTITAKSQPPLTELHDPWWNSIAPRNEIDFVSPAILGQCVQIRMN